MVAATGLEQLIQAATAIHPGAAGGHRLQQVSRRLLLHPAGQHAVGRGVGDHQAVPVRGLAAVQPAPQLGPEGGVSAVGTDVGQRHVPVVDQAQLAHGQGAHAPLQLLQRQHGLQSVLFMHRDPDHVLWSFGQLQVRFVPLGPLEVLGIRQRIGQFLPWRGDLTQAIGPAGPGKGSGLSHGRAPGKGRGQVCRARAEGLARARGLGGAEGSVQTFPP